MNLIVDSGNTLVKLALYEAESLVGQGSVEQLTREAVEEFLAGRSVQRAILCSSRGEVEEQQRVLQAFVGEVVCFDDTTPVPLKNAYQTPHSLGRDRLAAAVGAAGHYPNRNLLVVDFGTAITIDFVTADGTYRGGVISLGMQSRFRALHDYTHSLPLCAPTRDAKLQGLTTEEAICQGVMNSIAFEIEGYIARMEQKFDDLCVIFTGGDAKYFVKRIKNTIFANWNLVFDGLNRILTDHVGKENRD